MPVYTNISLDKVNELAQQGRIISIKHSPYILYPPLSFWQLDQYDALVSIIQDTADLFDRPDIAKMVNGYTVEVEETEHP